MWRGAKAGSRCARRWAPDSRDGEARFWTAREPPGGMMGPSAGLPNMRLKLPGGDRFRGSGVVVPWRARTDVQHPCAGARVARSLTAFR
jgi:hypothetical protein